MTAHTKTRSTRWTDYAGFAGLGLGLIALALTLRTGAEQPKLVMVSVKTLIETEQTRLLSAGADAGAMRSGIDRVASEVDARFRALEAQGYTVLVREAVLAGQVPDLTSTLQSEIDLLLAADETFHGLGRPGGDQGRVSGSDGPDTLELTAPIGAPSLGDRLAGEIDRDGGRP